MTSARFTYDGGHFLHRYRGERKNVIFACSATPMAAKDTFRLFFGGGDGTVGTAVVEVNVKSSTAKYT